MSARLVRPFLDVITESLFDDHDASAGAWQPAPSARVPLTAVFELLEQAEFATGDRTIGLRAARRLQRGAGDVLELIAASAPTLGRALEGLVRYSALLSDASQFSLSSAGTRCVLSLDAKLRMPASAVEFQAAAITRGVLSWSGALDGLEISFRHAAPSDPGPYAAAFRAAKLSFASDHDAILFPAPLFDWPLPHADPALHEVLVRHAERSLVELRHRAERGRYWLTPQLDPQSTARGRRVGYACARPFVPAAGRWQGASRKLDRMSRPRNLLH